MFKVGIIGPESTGKSSLASYLATLYKGTCVPEYARTYVERLVESRKSKAERWQDIITYDDVCEIARHQIEELKSQSDDIVFFDTELIVTKVWFEYAFGHMPEWLDEALVSYPMDIYLLTYPDLPWIPDPARSNGSDTIRLELFERYEAEVQALGIPYFIIRHED